MKTLHTFSLTAHMIIYATSFVVYLVAIYFSFFSLCLLLWTLNSHSLFERCMSFVRISTTRYDYSFHEWTPLWVLMVSFLQVTLFWIVLSFVTLLFSSRSSLSKIESQSYTRVQNLKIYLNLHILMLYLYIYIILIYRYRYTWISR